MEDVLTVTEAYDEIRVDDFVYVQHADGSREGVKVDGVMWLSGHHKPLQIVSSRGRRYALGEEDRIILKERSRGF